MLNYSGNYNLSLSFGLNEVHIDPSNLKEFTITQDINKYLPSVSIKLIDGQGLFTHLVPSDKLLSRIHIQIGTDLKVRDDTYNDLDFTVYSRSPEGLFTVGNDYALDGLLTTDALLAPSFSRSFSGNVANSLISLATSLGCTSFEISDNLQYNRTLIQANWTNAEFIGWLRSFLQGKDSDSAYQIFIKRVKGESIFVCRTLKDLFSQSVKYKFVVHKDPVKDYFPVFQYSIFDSYKLLGAFGSKKQEYHYFDYFNSKFVTNSVDATDMFSLSDYFLIDNDDVPDSDSIDTLGRNTENTEDYEYFVRGKYFNRLNSLVKMWALTWGLPNVCPGDVVQVLFSQGQDSGNLQSYQHSGYWLVERVVSSFTGTHRTRLLLTRSGVDTDKGTTLVKATDVKL